ncbi:MAG: AAA family ATPase [Syntrophus sp. (in: bacteria)]
MTNTMQSLRIKIDRVPYADPASGFVVMRGREGTNQVLTAIGILPDVMTNTDIAGNEYELLGDWKTDAKYGRQFAFVKGRMIGNQLLYFLTKVVKGLGEILVTEIIAQYGESRLIEILEKEPELLLEHKGIKAKKLSKIKSSWEKQKSLRELSDYLLPAGVTPNLLVRAYNQFGVNAVHKIRENPYCLTEITGIGFKSADNVARKLDIAFDSPFRLRAAILYVLQTAADEKGHTCLPFEDLFAGMREILNAEGMEVSENLMRSALDYLAGTGNLFSDDAGVSIVFYRQMEKWLLSFFRGRSTALNNPIVDPDKAEQYIARSQNILGFSFSLEQKEIINRIAAGRSRVYALLGYAGTGKSTISRPILDFLAEYHCRRDDIVCCAFTGMASARIKKLTGYPSYTIHTLLKYKGENQFVYNRENRLPHRVILLDEASMVNLPLFYRLAQAVADDATFIMVGDPAQLPPIGAGNVFCDITAKESFPKTTLTSIFRQSSNSVLVHFANIIRRGIMPAEYASADYLDFSFQLQDIPSYFNLKKELPELAIKKIKDENNEKIRNKIIDVASLMTTHLSHPSWEFQVLTPVRRGILGTEALNPALQNILNPRGSNPIEVFGITLREGDKVVHLRNKDMDTAIYDQGIFARDRDTFDKQRVFNGSVGLVVKIDAENDEFFVLYPERLLVRYDFDQIQDLIDLAYCLTVHKAQGSQYKYVAIPLSNSHYMMLNNKWFYTALTRAEKKVFLIGQDYAFRRACTNIDTARRLTFMVR